MKVTADDFRKRYAALSDEGLLEVDRRDLVDVARECYDQEVARRGLASRRRAVIQAPADPEMSEPAGEPVSVAVFADASEAGAARAILRAEGIPCFLRNEHLSTVRWSLGFATHDLSLMVPEEYEGRARELLADAPAGDDLEAEPWDGEVRHRFVETNGIRMHVAEAGVGPLVVLLHGFPETYSSWRHQLQAFAAEGYHVVAPDLRGYGQTDRPEALEAYDIFQLTADIVGLVTALGAAPAVLMGHDWGAWLAPYCALLRPELFRAVALLSVPFVPRRAVNESTREAQKYPGKIFYQAMLRSPAAPSVFGSDVRQRLLSGLWTLSGDVSPEQRWKPVRDADAPIAALSIPSGLPPWLAEEDLDFVVGEFERTGFAGGLNYYRNMDRNWELTAFLDGAKLLQRTLFAAGSEDPVLEFLDEEYDALEENVPNLWRKVLIPGAGHWIQQERPAEVNRLLIEFLREVEAGERAQ